MALSKSCGLSHSTPNTPDRWPRLWVFNKGTLVNHARCLISAPCVTALHSSGMAPGDGDSCLRGGGRNAPGVTQLSVASSSPPAASALSTTHSHLRMRQGDSEGQAVRSEKPPGQEGTAVVSDSRGASNPAGSEGPAWAGLARGPLRWKVWLLPCQRSAGPVHSWEWASGGSRRYG